ncbi:NAD(P)-binding protein [Hypoxylon fragiforme]|uniref:NAD(P)-binding protein n=1 Tax=Hypoxylon fragiforme TaxID=63214 RepID=UPI0020C621EE|nr:NAD(P)-binding protein [Hypoxylon fragiforme]KAI2605470.1 NAD(P)-binding protein [Hypoxylon fragiforme]
MAGLRLLRPQGLLPNPLTTTRTSVRPTKLGLRAPASQVQQARRISGPYGYTSAKALVFSEYGEPKDVLNLHTHSISPMLPPSSVLLRTLAAPINPADMNTIQGVYAAKPPFSSLIGTEKPSAIPGNEGVFEVVSSSSPTFSKGDWVIPKHTQFGTWRTHALTPADTLIKLDKAGLTPLQAATVAVNPSSAYRMLRDFVSDPTPMREGDWFVQNGANSAVGRAAIQLGRLWGYRSINVVRARPTPEATEALKHELLELGATRVVTDLEFESRAFQAEVADLTSRDSAAADGVRLGLNCVGGKSAQAMTRVLGRGGTLVTYGGMARQPIELPASRLIFKDLRFFGFWLSRWADRNPAAKEQTVHDILSLIREGKLADAPVVEVPWTWGTKAEELRGAVQRTLDGFKSGKGVFVFRDT